jgi:hypothetical protein
MNYPFAMKTALTIRGVTVGFECTYIGNSALEGVTGSLLVISRTTYRVGKGARLPARSRNVYGKFSPIVR